MRETFAIRNPRISSASLSSSARPNRSRSRGCRTDSNKPANAVSFTFPWPARRVDQLSIPLSPGVVRARAARKVGDTARSASLPSLCGGRSRPCTGPAHLHSIFTAGAQPYGCPVLRLFTAGRLIETAPPPRYRPEDACIAPNGHTAGRRVSRRAQGSVIRPMPRVEDPPGRRAGPRRASDGLRPPRTARRLHREAPGGSGKQRERAGRVGQQRAEGPFPGPDEGRVRAESRSDQPHLLPWRGESDHAE